MISRRREPIKWYDDIAGEPTTLNDIIKGEVRKNLEAYIKRERAKFKYWLEEISSLINYAEALVNHAYKE
jgi:hypothetical protein